MEVKLTRQQKEKLIGFLPFSTDATEEYIPGFLLEMDIEKEFLPIFILRPMKVIERNEWDSLSRKTIKALENPEELGVINEKLNKLAAKCVLGIKNLVDLAKQNIVEPEIIDGHVSYEFFKGMPKALINDINDRLLRISGIRIYDKTQNSEKLGL